MNKISGVYKITNTVTGEFYIGSSINVKDRWVSHKCPSTWKAHPNSRMYQDMQKYCVDKFKFEIIEETTELKQREQYWMNLLKPKYNNYNAKGRDIERRKRVSKEYYQSEKGKEIQKKYFQSEKGKGTMKKYLQSEKGKKTQKKYSQSEKGKKTQKKYFQSEKGKKAKKKYKNQLCVYNGETLTLNALYLRFCRAGIEHPTLEAKKYLEKQ